MIWQRIYRFFRSIKNTILAFIFLIYTVSIGAEFIPPSKTILLAPFGLIFLPLYFLILSVFIVYLKRNKWIAFIAFVSLLLGINTLKKTIAYQPVGEEKGLKVMSWNVKNFDLYNWTNNQKTRKNIFSKIEELNPDIICFQEFYTNRKQRNNIAQLKKMGFKHFVFYPAYSLNNDTSQWGLAIFSKYRLKNPSPVILHTTKSKMNQAVLAYINYKDKDIAIYNAHFQSLHLSYDELKYIENLKSDIDAASTKSSRNIILKILTAYRSREVQIENLLKKLSKDEYRIICTDMNDVPSSYAYHRLGEEHNDAFLMRGRGLSNTISVGLISYRIDYILTTKNILVNHYRKINTKLSDHHIIMAHIDI